MKQFFILLLVTLTGFGQSWADDQMEKKVVVKIGESKGAWLGVMVAELDKGSSEEGVTAAEYGAVVQSVLDDTPAEKSGIEAGDVIIKLDDKRINGSKDLIKTLRQYKPGQIAKVQLYRGDKKVLLDVELGAKQKVNNVFIPGQKHIRMYRRENHLGAKVQEMDKDLAAYFRLKAGTGVLVTQVDKNSPAGKAGLKSGDVITAIGDNKVGTEAEVEEALDDYDEGEKIDITIVRKGRKQKLSAVMEEEEEVHVFKKGAGGFFGDGEFKWHFENLKEHQKDLFELKELYNDEIKERLKIELEKSRMKTERELEKIEKELERMREEIANLKK